MDSGILDKLKFFGTSDFLSIALTVLLCVAVVAAVIGLCLIPTNVAGKKGYSRFGFFVFSLFLWIPALIVALCLTDRRGTASASAAEGLAKLNEVYSNGGMTEAEYEKAKKKLLKKIK